MSILLAILALMALVVAHELGHFLAARAYRIHISEFGIGIPPRLAQITRGGIRYSLNLLPIGGFVNFADPQEEQGGESERDPERFFPRRPVRERAVVLFAGVGANFLLAIGLLSFLGTPFYQPMITGVVKNSPAAAAGLLPGDRITVIDGHEVALSGDPQQILTSVHNLIDRSRQNPVRLVVEQGGRSREVSVLRGYDWNDAGLGSGPKIGVLLGIHTVFRHRGGLVGSVGAALTQSYRFAGAVLGYIGKMVSGHSQFRQIGGPVQVVGVTASAVRTGWQFFLYVVALISLNLGIMNLLPIPGLDGGQLLFLGAEVLRGGPLDQRRLGIINTLGILLVFGLVLLLTVRDILQYLRAS